MEIKELNVVVTSCFNSHQGKKVLEYLVENYGKDPILTSDPIEMARALGRRDVVIDILSRIDEVNK